jgi:hypothetical protein
LDALKNAAPTLGNKWLVAAFDNWVDDFKGHEGKKQLIVGFFPQENDFKYVVENGKTYLVANAIISKIYAEWAFEIFKRDNIKECSMEITVVDSEERNDGFTWITGFVFNGVTLLSNKIHAACPGSNATLVKFSEQEFIEQGEKAYKYFIPQSIKDLAKQYENGTSVAKSISRYLTKNKIISPKKATFISKYFSNHLPNEIYDWCNKINKECGNMAEFTVGDKLGKSPAIDIDNSKDSAVKSGSWSGQNAGFLNKLLEASNHASLVKEAYARVSKDASGDLSVNDVGYEHHVIRGGKLILSVPGVQAAYKRARQQGETGSIMSHIKRHRKALGLEKEGGEKMSKKKSVAQFGITTDEMKNMMVGLCNTMTYKDGEQDVPKYCLSDYCNQYMYCFDKSTGLTMAIPYAYEDGKVNADFENAKKARMSYIIIDDDDDDETDDEYMARMTDMAKAMLGYSGDDANTEAIAAAARMKQESDGEKESLAKENMDLRTKVQDMEAIVADMEKKTQELESFKSNILEKMLKNEKIKDSHKI